GRRAQLPEVPGPRGRHEGQHRAQGGRHRRHQARTRQAAAVKPEPKADGQSIKAAAAQPSAYTALDHLATMVAIVQPDGRCVFANAAFEHVLGLSRRSVLRGIRGAAQLLEMEVESRTLTEYTQVIIQEADRLQALVDRLLAPHRKPHVVSDVNIHEVCERVRSLILAEFPRGLAVLRDYDISIPDFRGDREQLIQAVLNIAHNAAHALSERMAVGDACITLRTRISRQVTLGKQRYRLAL